MSLPLKDIKNFKVRAETHAVLRALARKTGRDINELAREALAEWANEKVHESTLIHDELESERLAGNISDPPRRHGMPPK